MHRYILKRLLLMVPTLFGVAVLVFFLLRVAPGDIVELKYAGSGTFAPKEALDRERAQLGLDKPLAHQFVAWIVGVGALRLRQLDVDRPADHRRNQIRLELSLQLAVMATVGGDLDRTASGHAGGAETGHMDRLRWCASFPSAVWRCRRFGWAS